MHALIKINIMVLAGFAMPEKCRITVTDSNEKNMNWDSGSCIFFCKKWKYFDMLDNYAYSEKLGYEKSVERV